MKNNLEILESDSLSILIDSTFPRIIKYKHKKTKETLNAQSSRVNQIKLNNVNTEYDLSCKKMGRDVAVYKLFFPEQRIEVDIEFIVAEDFIEIRMKDVKESGSFKLMNIVFPENTLLSINDSVYNAALAATYFTSRRLPDGTVDERDTIGEIKYLDLKEDTANYFFISSGKLAAGIASNHIVDCERVSFSIREEDGIKTCRAWMPVWQYREIESETLELPFVKVFITPDINGDNDASWQDAALVYRKNMPAPLGGELIRNTVGHNIAMNFASCSQQPFLRILDNIKRIYLATDGLGNQVLIKGYTAEGHDSANSDCFGNYNERAGGLKDLTFLLQQAEKYNSKIGVHINVTDISPEAHRYNPDLIKYNETGEPEHGWNWLDQYYSVDKRKDILEGSLLASLEKMREEMPLLDFLYVDTYCDNGWVAWELANKIKYLQLPLFTEMARAFDPWSVWGHRRFENDIAHFIWYSERDIFLNTPILRGGRSDGFMGWNNQFDFNLFLNDTFTIHLPAKYLQHFDLLRWKRDREAVFSEEVKVSKKNNNVVVTKKGIEIMRWKNKGEACQLFIPWPPENENKIYVWNEVNKRKSWHLPDSWKQYNEVYLYQLTDQGKREEKKLEVSKGEITLEIDKSTPYVIYPVQNTKTIELDWGEGSYIQDPGFNCHDFKYWKPKSSSDNLKHIRLENDKNGNSRLLISGNKGADAEVSQLIYDLPSGNTYSASVWVQVKGVRKASINIAFVKDGKQQCFSNYVLKTDVKHGLPNDPRTGTNFQRIKVLFDIPQECSELLLTLKAERGLPETEVEFADLRLVKTFRSPKADKHWFFEDFENTDMGYGPFSCCFNEYTHLSETNHPYTNDTINGRYSLKINNDNKEPELPVLRTLPSAIRFRPLTRYQLSCETLTCDGVKAEMQVISGGKIIAEQKFPDGRGQIKLNFMTNDDPDTYIALFKSEGEWIVIDDIAIDEL